jgi:hypothetical protein
MMTHMDSQAKAVQPLRPKLEFLLTEETQEIAPSKITSISRALLIHTTTLTTLECSAEPAETTTLITSNHESHYLAYFAF